MNWGEAAFLVFVLLITIAAVVESAASGNLVTQIRSSLPRLVGEVCFIALTWLLAGIAYLLNRHAATAPLLVAGFLVVGAEYAYDVNTYASTWIGGRAVSPLGRFANLLSFVLGWPMALVAFAVGAILFFTSSAP